jgi:hypothetical protein
MLTFNDYGSLGVGQIPSGNVVNSAILTLNLRSLTIHPSYTGTPLLYVAPITSSFAGSDSNAYLGTSAPAFDTSKAVSLNLTGLTGSDSTFITIDITSIVQSWYDGSLGNYGLALYTADNLNNNYLLSASFRSANAGYNGASAPMLTIDFSAIPEPSTYTLLLGGLCLLTGLRYWRKLA